jgi:GMP synthase-like glutamine amidotransferase
MSEAIRVLALIHGTNARGGVFYDAIDEAGHRYDEWSLAWGTPPPVTVEDYEAVIVLGGSMHADQDDRHPWLREEDAFIRDLLERRVPLLGVCLGIQLIAKAAGAAVYPLGGGPEIGWFPVELAAAAAEDPVLGGLPGRFDAFGWHYYSYDLPPGAEELARSTRCNQAYRFGEAAWGVQFHPEVTLETVRSWLDDKDDFPLELDRDELWSVTQDRIGAWNDLGRNLCGAFLELASSGSAGETLGELSDVRT